MFRLELFSILCSPQEWSINFLSIALNFRNPAGRSFFGFGLMRYPAGRVFWIDILFYEIELKV